MTTTSNPESGLPVPFSAPDASVIARLANEFFSTLPVEPTAAPVAGVPVAPVDPSLPLFPPEPITLNSLPPLTASEFFALSPFSVEPSFLGLATPFSHPWTPSNVEEGPHREGNRLRQDEPAIVSPEKVILEDTNQLTQKDAIFDQNAPSPKETPGSFSNSVFSPDFFSFVPIVLPGGTSGDAHPAFDAAWYKKDFPILQKDVHGKPLIWLDNAATTQKPQAVIDRLDYFYLNENSNVHRAAHTLAARATDAYEGARETVRRFLGASSAREIVFVRGATEAINLVAKAWGSQNIGEGDEIVISWLEHHANIVPWQQLASEKGAKLRVIPVDDRGQVLLTEYEKLLNSRTKIVSVTQVSNALGTVVPVREMVEIAHRHGIRILVDGAQSVSHMRINLSELNADFFVFSGHKVFGPTGIGVLYGKEELLNSFQPWQGGGNMIADVTFEKTLYQSAPSRFEAGTGNIADAVGLGAALDYLQRVGLDNVSRHEHDLLVYATELLKKVSGLRLIGTTPEKAGVLSFVITGIKNEEIGQALNKEGIAVRSGHHCAQPILRRFGLESTVRASLAFYNTFDDLEALARVLCDLTKSRP